VAEDTDKVAQHSLRRWRTPVRGRTSVTYLQDLP
jgi:hypothetical protein